MSGRFFLDTHILVDSFDATDGRRRQQRAQALIATGLEGAGVISFQVVQEFLNVALRKFTTPMSVEQAQRYLEVVLVPLCRVQSDPDLYREALAVRLRWRFSWSDSLVVAAAQRAGREVQYSEDLQHGQQLGGVRVEDPFRGVQIGGLGTVATPRDLLASFRTPRD
jgi:predicted nucleic acid-binding protein